MSLLKKHKSKKSNISPFLIKDGHNNGFKVQLVEPDGSPSKYWLVIRGTYSDEYLNAFEIHKKAQFDFVKELEKLEKNKVKDKAKINKITNDYINDKYLDLISSLIADWNIEDESGIGLDCSKDNIKWFLSKAPQIAEQVVREAQIQTNFTKKN